MLLSWSKIETNTLLLWSWCQKCAKKDFFVLDPAAAYERHASQIHRYCLAHFGADAGPDIAAETWLRAVEKWHTYEERGYPVTAWLYRIAWARGVDRLRQARRRPTVPLAECDHTTPPPALPVDWSVLDVLEGDQRRVIVARYLLGYSLTETAQRLGRSVGATKALQHRAITRLREVVNDPPSI